MPTDNLSQLGLLTAIAVAGIGVGTWLYPGSDVNATLPGRFMLGVPSAVRDSQGIAEVTVVSWQEVHRAADPLPVPSDLAGGIPAHSTRVALGINFKRKLAEDVPIEMTVRLPAGITVISCTSPDGAAVQCHADTSAPNPLYLEDTTGITITGTVKAADPQAPLHSGLSVHMDLGGADGIGFATSPTRVKVQFPLVGFPANPSIPVSPSTTNPSYMFAMMAFLPDPGNVTWSVSPSGLGANMPSMVGWNIKHPSDSTVGAVPVTGVRDDLVRANSDKSFWSGIFYGVAGGAGIALLQGLLVSKRRAKR
jgi:hypothetical protein